MSLDGENLIQVTLKPIYPTAKFIAADKKSAREIVGGIVAELVSDLNSELEGAGFGADEGYSPLAEKEGGTTSVDVMRADVDKSKAAKDLLKSFKLEAEPDLLLAMDDEMSPNAVGFPFLTVDGITVISMEKTGDGKKRQYPRDIWKKIRAFLLWSEECGMGTEVEATKNIFSQLILACEKEMWEVLVGEKSASLPAIRRLKNELMQKVNVFELLKQESVFSAQEALSLLTPVESSI